MTGHDYAPGLDESGFVEVCQLCKQPAGDCTYYDPGPVPDENFPADPPESAGAEPARAGRQVVVTLASSIRPSITEVSGSSTRRATSCDSM